jgi:hypothetical protein
MAAARKIVMTLKRMARLSFMSSGLAKFTTPRGPSYRRMMAGFGPNEIPVIRTRSGFVGIIRWPM